MNKTIFFLLTLFSFVNNSLAQTSAEQEGFWVEVFQHQSLPAQSKNFINYETIKNLPLDSALTMMKNEQARRTWVGPKLCKLLETINIPCKKIQTLTISAPDGYSSVISGELLSALSSAICAYRFQNQKQWDENYGYMRLIFPELRGMHWVNRPDKMVIILGEDHRTLHHYQFYFLNNEQLNHLVKKDLKGNSYLIIDDLLVKFGLPQNGFQVITADGLLREYPSNEINRYLLIQRQEDGTWNINGINVPNGMKMRQVIFLSSSNKGVFLKALNDEEQVKWENTFWQPKLGREVLLNDLRIVLILKTGQTIPSELIEPFKQGRLSLYRLLEIEQKNVDNLDYFNLTW